MASSKPLNAASVGGTETAKKGKITISAENEYISGRNMKKGSMEINEKIDGLLITGQVETRYKIDSMNRTMAKFICFVNNRYDIKIVIIKVFISTYFYIIVYYPRIIYDAKLIQN